MHVFTYGVIVKWEVINFLWQKISHSLCWWSKSSFKMPESTGLKRNKNEIIHKYLKVKIYTCVMGTFTLR